MSVSPKQPVEAEIVNQAFMSRIDDTSTEGKVHFQNTSDSVDLGTGAILVEGGAAVKKSLQAGGLFKAHGRFELKPVLNEILSGANANLDPGVGTLIVLTNPSLESLSTISGIQDGRILMIVNAAVTKLLIPHLGPGTATERIYSSTTKTIEVPYGGVLLLTYCEEVGRWLAISGNGGGSGGAGLILATIAERDAIAEDLRSVGLEVFVVEANTKYRLLDGVLNANWVAEGSYEDVSLSANGPLAPAQKTMDGFYTVKSTGTIRTLSGITQTNLRERARVTLVGVSDSLPVVVEPDANMVMNGTRIYLKSGMSISFVKLGTKMYQTAQNF